MSAPVSIQADNSHMRITYFFSPQRLFPTPPLLPLSRVLFLTLPLATCVSLLGYQLHHQFSHHYHLVIPWTGVHT